MDTIHMWLTFVVITCTILAFAAEKWSIEGVSLATIVALLAIFVFIPQPERLNPVEVPDLLMGFANPALITVLALLVIGQALFNTDALEAPARFLSKLGGSNVKRTAFILLLAAGVTSAFLNNTPVIVMFIPIVVAIAAQRNFSASTILLPLSYVGILGGMTTLIGSSTNLLVAGVAQRYGEEIGFFDFTMPGLVLASVGFVYILFVMPLVLGERKIGAAMGEAGGRQFLAQIDVTEGRAGRLTITADTLGIRVIPPVGTALRRKLAERLGAAAVWKSSQPQTSKPAAVAGDISDEEKAAIIAAEQEESNE